MNINPNDFNVSKFYAYYGPNHYINCKALVFNIYLDPEGPDVDFYIEEINQHFPTIIKKKPSTVINLFAETLLQTLKMDIDLFLNNYEISEDGNDYVIAIEYLEKKVSEEAIHLLSQWYKAMNEKKPFDFATEFIKLQAKFDKSILGGPTIYSLVEAGLKRSIPVFFLYTENQFQWGYGRKQLRGRSTTFHTDGIKDTEFTMYKDMVGEFLMDCGFPTPQGEVVFSEEDAIAVAKRLGFPVVVKPVAGHKGQGVTTGIESEEEVIKAYKNIILYAKNEGIQFDGALVQQQIYGTDHRLLTVGGKFAAALERVPAFVVGDGNKTIEELIKIENDKLIRLDNARSPLCKIKIDEDLKDYLKLQNLALTSVPKAEQNIVLRRVANISAGGVSINVTDKMHPDNVKMVESIAQFFKVKCLGIDVLAKDISTPWHQGNFGIIEINAGPGVFMHLAPAYGGSIDVPGKIMETHFYKPEFARIPIIAGNNISKQLADKISESIKTLDSTQFIGMVLNEGVFFENEYFYKNKHHDKNIEIVLRNPEVDFAIFNHNKDDIYDYGFFHQGADIVILDNAKDAERALSNIKTQDGFDIVIENNEISYQLNGQKQTFSYTSAIEKEDIIISIIKKQLKELVTKYD